MINSIWHVTMDYGNDLSSAEDELVGKFSEMIDRLSHLSPAIGLHDGHLTISLAISAPFANQALIRAENEVDRQLGELRIDSGDTTGFVVMEWSMFEQQQRLADELATERRYVAELKRDLNAALSELRDHKTLVSGFAETFEPSADQSSMPRYQVAWKKGGERVPESRGVIQGKLGVLVQRLVDEAHARDIYITPERVEQEKEGDR